MLALLLLGRQFQWYNCAPEPTRCHHDRCVSGSVQQTDGLEFQVRFLLLIQISILIITCHSHRKSWTRKEAFYNHNLQDTHSSEREGVSVFYKDPAGRVFHTYSAYARGIDMLNVAYHYLDLVPKGWDEEDNDFPQFWVRRHDEYGK